MHAGDGRNIHIPTLVQESNSYNLYRDSKKIDMQNIKRLIHMQTTRFFFQNVFSTIASLVR